MALAEAETRKPIPFDVEQLDRLLDDAGIDVLVATSKHNIQYLLGGYRFFFFDSMDAVGVSRYLPALVYRKGKPEQAAYIGCGMESYERELGKFWPANLDLSVIGSKETMQHALDHIKKLGGVRRVGVEFGVPAGRRRGRAASGPVELRHRRCGVSAGAAACVQDAGGDRIPARVVRARRGVDAGDLCAVQAGHDQAGGQRDAAA